METHDGGFAGRSKFKMQNSKCKTNRNGGAAFRRPWVALALAVFGLAMLTTACGDSAPPKQTPALKELQHTTGGGMNVVLLAAGDTLKSGKDTAYLEFRSAGDQRLTDVGTVKVSATMPMAGMPPMMGSMFVHKTETAGRYSIDTDLGMVGTWTIGVEWDRGPAGPGKVTFPGTVQ
jgi:YtkA-like